MLRALSTLATEMTSLATPGAARLKAPSSPELLAETTTTVPDRLSALAATAVG